VRTQIMLQHLRRDPMGTPNKAAPSARFLASLEQYFPKAECVPLATPRGRTCAAFYHELRGRVDRQQVACATCGGIAGARSTTAMPF
jgi:hypothetical protein